ncbi:porin [Starkeya sp. ORNL1]|uniref:porin n=1 Tax=Starkeya sp. ORNL1 TaxID=2709380 RepID=UPI001FEF4AA6|nr:porin [Starkeya sp. ORNL1]
MKTVIKNVLLGSVAGLAMVGTAAAADLPVKAKAAEYVKICSTYGAGYYYIPGTDTCLKIGGYVTADFYVENFKNEDNFSVDYDHPGGYSDRTSGNANFSQSDTESYFKTRAAIQMDARTQTEYGTLRSYFEMRYTYGSDSAQDYTADTLRLKYGYIQFAGFTFGKATSNFDFWAGDFYEGIDPGFFYSDATPLQIAYTADFGNGFSATIAIEDAYERTRDYFDIGIDSSFGEHRQEVPDIVANLSYEGSWGAARLSGALHRLEDQYGNFNSQPNDDWGWAALAGVRFDIAETTTIYLEGAYADGALGYLGFGATGVMDFADGDASNFGGAQSVDFNGDSISGWYVGGGIRHYWVPTVFTSFVGSYGETDSYTTFDGVNTVNSGFPNPDYVNQYEQGKDKVYSLAANIGWKPVKGLQFVLQYDRVWTEFSYNGRINDSDAPSNYWDDSNSYSGNNKQITDRILLEAKRSF